MTGDRKRHGEDLGAPTAPKLGFATPTAPPWHRRALRPPAAPEACGLHPASAAQPPGLLPKILLPSSPPPSRLPSHGPAAEPAPLAGLRSRCVTRPRRTSLLAAPHPAGVEAGSCSRTRGCGPRRTGSLRAAGQHVLPGPRANSRARGRRHVRPRPAALPSGSLPRGKSQGAGRRWSRRRL